MRTPFRLRVKTAFAATLALSMLFAFAPAAQAATPVPSSAQTPAPSPPVSPEAPGAAPFAVEGLSTDRAPVSGGGSVVITGHGLSDPVGVRFGDTPATVSPVQSGPSIYLGASDDRGPAHFAAASGRDPAIMNKFVRWAKGSDTDFNAFPAEWATGLQRRGIIPMLTWNPYYRSASCTAYAGQCPMSLSDIANGRYDTEIRAFAGQVAKAGVPIFLRLMHEANGGWYPWNVRKEADRSEYVAAWRHVHDIFDEAGASAVSWVWCPNVEKEGSSHAVPFTSFYPGDAYVDWTGLDGYNRHQDKSFATIFGSSLDRLRALSPRPVMIAEIGSAAFEEGQRTAFLTQTLASIPLDYPEVGAFVYMMNSHDVSLHADEGARRAFTGDSAVHYAGPGLAEISAGKIVPVQGVESVRASIPAHGAGEVDVRVTDGTGLSTTLSGAFRFVPADAVATDQGWVAVRRRVGTSVAVVATVAVIGALALVVRRRRRAAAANTSRGA